MNMKLDFTGLIDDSGFTNLPPGRYEVVTKPEWTAKKTVNDNMSLRVPFTVLERNEFEGSSSSFFHTIMVKGPADKLRQNKMFTLRLLTALGILSEDDRGPKGELETEFIFGDKNEYDSVMVTGIKVNGASRNLGGRVATAVSVTDSESSSGVKIKALEAKGNPSTNGVKAAPKSGVDAEPKITAEDFPF